MRTVTLAWCLSFFAAAAGEEWRGTWTNKKTRSSGTLRCVTRPDGEGKWKATFSGSFDGRPFNYNVAFQNAGSDEAVSGTATISNRKYKWEGTLTPEKLTGKYKADNGYFGDFNLRKKK